MERRHEALPEAVQAVQLLMGTQMPLQKAAGQAPNKCFIQAFAAACELCNICRP